MTTPSRIRAEDAPGAPERKRHRIARRCEGYNQRQVEFNAAMTLAALSLGEPDRISRSKREIQNIVFENADKIPDGVYKQLMDALMIED